MRSCFHFCHSERSRGIWPTIVRGLPFEARFLRCVMLRITPVGMTTCGPRPFQQKIGRGEAISRLPATARSLVSGLLQHERLEQAVTDRMIFLTGRRTAFRRLVKHPRPRGAEAISGVVRAEHILERARDNDAYFVAAVLDPSRNIYFPWPIRDKARRLIIDSDLGDASIPFRQLHGVPPLASLNYEYL